MVLAGAVDVEVAALDERHAGLGRLRQERVAVDPVEPAPEEVAAFGRAEVEAVAEVRAGINTRNAAVSSDGRYVIAANYLPHSLAVFDADLNLVRVIEARERCGGRGFAREFAGEGPTLEFGGAWITPWHHRLRALVPEHGLTLRPRHPVTNRLWLRTDLSQRTAE